MGFELRYSYDHCSEKMYVIDVTRWQSMARWQDAQSIVQEIIAFAHVVYRPHNWFLTVQHHEP
jgi:hypothetical protein